MGSSSLLNLAIGAVLVAFLSMRIAVPVQEDSYDPSAVRSSDTNSTEPLGSKSLTFLAHSYLRDTVGAELTCAEQIQEKYACEEEGCSDLIAGYINYIYFLMCKVQGGFVRFLASVFLIVWLLFLLHLVETTTNTFFVTALQQAVSILKLSPNVAGVTFLAVGNAACDVIASIAAFATGSPKVGVGTNLGAGIFVTTAVVAAVSFVADVRLARRSFIRDVLFFIATVVYLLIASLDGVITMAESIGFVIIYLVFVAVVGGGRFIRALRSDDESDSSKSTLPAHGVAPQLTNYQNTGVPSYNNDSKNEILRSLEQARREAITRSQRSENKFRSGNDDNSDDDGDLGNSNTEIPLSAAFAANGEDSMVNDLPTKSKAWSSTFDKTQAFSMPKYHRKKLAKKLQQHLASKNIHHEVTLPDGRVVDVAELAVTDPEEAAKLIASAASAVTAEAARHDGAISYQTAAAAAGTQAHGSAALQADLLAVMPQETIKPVAKMYVRFKKVLDVIGPYYHGFMHKAELPVLAARYLTIPMLEESIYRRRLLLIVFPLSFSLLTVVMTTHILKGSATTIGAGFPIWLLVLILLSLAAIPLHKYLLPNSYGGTQGAFRGESTSLLTSADVEAAAGNSGAGPSDLVPTTGEQQEEHHWYSSLVERVAGPTGDVPPTGPLFVFFLLVSFLMSLIWLLLIANELVGTALAFGKILHVPDTVMGLAVLAVGNSINDLAASVTIAREGFPAMAVAGAFAGPMFNIIGGIGLPMLIYNMKNPGGYEIGKNTPLVWVAFVVLLLSLTVTLIWVPMSGFRITHKIGRFLLTVFFGFILLVIIMGSVPSLAGETHLG